MLSKDDMLRRQAMWKLVKDQIHHFFKSRGYLEFRVPSLVRYPDMEPTVDPFCLNLEVPGQEPIKAALMTSPEFSMKKLVAAGFDRIYTTQRVFRNGEALGPHNAPEFSLLEWYRVGGDYKDCMQETMDLVNTVLEIEEDWPRIKHADANVDDAGDPHVDEKRFFLMDYPVEEAALAKISEDGTYAERFEAYADGMELCNGFSELIDPVEQRARFEKEQEKNRAAGKCVFGIDEELLEALAKIDKPLCGNALGVDRLAMLKYGISDINDLHTFPPRERFGNSD